MPESVTRPLYLLIFWEKKKGEHIRTCSPFSVFYDIYLSACFQPGHICFFDLLFGKAEAYGYLFFSF